MERITHLVIKVEDIQKYLNHREQSELGLCLEKIQEGRHNDGKEATPKYLIVNSDEPYFREVYNLVLEREKKK